MTIPNGKRTNGYDWLDGKTYILYPLILCNHLKKAPIPKCWVVGKSICILSHMFVVFKIKRFITWVAGELLSIFHIPDWSDWLHKFLSSALTWYWSCTGSKWTHNTEAVPPLLTCVESLQYEQFYDDEDYINVQWLHHIKYIHEVSLQYEFFHAFEDDFDVQRLYHIGDIHSDSLQSVPFYLLGN